MSTDEFDLTITNGIFTPGRRKNNLSATTAPVVTDDADSDYEVLSIWVDTTNDKSYICVDSTAGAAVWQQFSGTGAGGSVDADTIWDAKGDLAVGTGADTAERLAVGSDGEAIGADSSQSGGIRWGGFPELVMEDGVTNPPVPVENEAQDDWIWNDF